MVEEVEKAEEKKRGNINSYPLKQFSSCPVQLY